MDLSMEDFLQKGIKIWANRLNAIRIRMIFKCEKEEVVASAIRFFLLFFNVEK